MNTEGQKFGKLTALKFSKWYTCKSRNRYPIWKFECECGKTTEAMLADVKSGKTRSCGCSKIPHGDAVRGKEHPLYKVWMGMIKRCNNPRMSGYPNYGGRGIRVLWKNYSEFKRDMAGTFAKGLSIERIDVNGHYSAENCTWATPTEQARNRRNNHEIECHGIIMCISEWAEIFGMSHQSLRYRLNVGIPMEKALLAPVFHRGRKKIKA